MDELQECIRPGDTIVVASLDRFSPAFHDGLAIKEDLTRRGIWTIAIKEDLDTRDCGPGAPFYRRLLLAQVACQEQSARLAGRPVR